MDGAQRAQSQTPRGTKMDYSIFHVEKYGHGKGEMNELEESQKVRIADHDGYVDVYECDSDEEAKEIAQWYLSAGYDTYPAQVEIEKQDARYFTVEVQE